MWCIAKVTTTGCTICTIPWWSAFSDVPQIAAYHNKLLGAVDI